MKRGSLQLSINAIVILIMAIAMLGVGIFFINSVRDEVTDFSGLTDEAKESTKIILQQTGEKLSVSGLRDGTLEMGQNAEATINVAILNTLDSQGSFLVDVKLNTPDRVAGNDLGLTTFYTQSGTRINVGDLETVLVEFESTNVRGRVIYTAEVWVDTDNNDQIGGQDEFFGGKTFHVQVN